MNQQNVPYSDLPIISHCSNSIIDWFINLTSEGTDEKQKWRKTRRFKAKRAKRNYSKHYRMVWKHKEKAKEVG